MVEIRRVITGPNGDGVSAVLADGLVPRFWEVAGRSVAAVWEIPTPFHAETPGGDPVDVPLPMIPAPGWARFLHIVFPPAGSGGEVAPEAYEEEARAKVGGREKYFDEARGKGVHATPTVDVMFISSGSVDLILESETVTLNAGDCAVLDGAWHGWNNAGDTPCVVVGVNFATEPSE
jgi:mannose-6-phosphate isomerase-like protein (cupin superfamily)